MAKKINVKLILGASQCRDGAECNRRQQAHFKELRR